jgi:hypothetical protein
MFELKVLMAARIRVTAVRRLSTMARQVDLPFVPLISRVVTESIRRSMTYTTTSNTDS